MSSYINDLLVIASGSAVSGAFASAAAETTSRDWTSTLFFTLDADDAVNPPIQILHDALKKSVKEYLGIQEQIQEVWVFKCNLAENLSNVPGVWHEYVIIKSENWYWSFEKNNLGITVQRSNNFETIKNKIHGVNRPGGVEQKLHNDIRGETTIQHVFDWMHETHCLSQTYHITGSNCRGFAKALFEEITSSSKGN